ncbi:hypothetical protein SALBM311S_08740 [Streptomyces alboniger]
MTTPPDDRSFRREMATAYRSGWHFIDLATAIPHAGDSLMVTVFGEPVVVTRDEDEDVRAYRCLRKPRGAPQPVRCAIRYGMIFVNLDQRDHRLVEPDAPDIRTISATPPQCLTRFPRRNRSLRCFPPQRRHRDLNTVTPLQFSRDISGSRPNPVVAGTDRLPVRSYASLPTARALSIWGTRLLGGSRPPRTLSGIDSSLCTLPESAS